jgi:CRISPR-associated protein Cmr3
MTRLLLIEPRDPLLFRDGRPFSAGLSASSLPFPPPSITAGMMRTILGEPTNYSNLAELNSVVQTGPFLVCSDNDGETWQYALPKPADAVVYERESQAGNPPFRVVALRPAKPEQSSGVFEPPAVPQLLFGAIEDKPAARAPQFWTWEFYERWLSDPKQCEAALPPEMGPLPLGRHKRMHVAISADTHTAGEGLLFATDNVEFITSERIGAKRRQFTRFALVCRFEIPESLGQIDLPRLGTLGGESRIVAFNLEAAPPLPACPIAVQNFSTRVRLVLATPGLFDQGWRPGWLTEEGGSHPDHPEIRLRLVSAAVPRPLPVSGWDLVAGKPKPSRLLAPAGSTFFCEVQGDASALWLKSLCHDQAARDGFGIVTLGVW